MKSTFYFRLSFVITIIAACFGCAIDQVATDEPPLPPGVTESTSVANAIVTISNQYILNNNEWNASHACPPYSETVFKGTSGGVPFIGWSWSWNNSDQWTVLSYPEVFFGRSPWAPSGWYSQGFTPFTVGSHTLSSTFDITQSTSCVRGCNTYDLAYDIWVLKSSCNPSNFTAGDIKCEIMIWLDAKNAVPDGLSPSGSLSANGCIFNYYYNPNQSSGTSYSWIYAAFSAGTPVLQSTNFDITPFLSYLTCNGVLATGDYVATVELGTEVAIGSGQVIIKKYSVTVGP